MWIMNEIEIESLALNFIPMRYFYKYTLNRLYYYFQ